VLIFRLAQSIQTTIATMARGNQRDKAREANLKKLAAQVGSVREIHDQALTPDAEKRQHFERHGNAA
jgi:hypothetical protein